MYHQLKEVCKMRKAIMDFVDMYENYADTLMRYLFKDYDQF